MEKFTKDYKELNNIKGLTSSSRKLYNEMRNFLQLSKNNKEYQDENGVPFIFFTESRAKEIGISIITYKRAKKQLKDLGLINYKSQENKKLGVASKIYVEEDLKKVIEKLKALDPVVKNKKVETKKTVKQVKTNNVVENKLIEELLKELNNKVDNLQKENAEIKKQNEELNNKVDELTKKVDELSNNQKPTESIVAKEKSNNIEISIEQTESTTNETNANKIETKFNPMEFDVFDNIMDGNKVDMSQEPPLCVITNEEKTDIETSTNVTESTTNESSIIETSIIEPTPFFKGKLGFNNDIDRHLEEWKNDTTKIKEFEAKESKKKRARKAKQKLSFEETMKLNEGKPFIYENEWYGSDGKPYVYNTQIITKKVNIIA